VSSPVVGVDAAVFGHPNGQTPLQISPARVVIEEEAVGRDLYDAHTTKREILVLAADLAHGDSGGALVNPSGQVIGVAFAISANQAGTAYALSSSELRAALAEPRQAAGVSTGPCLSS
jgi:S1-C subfamily serine protease